MQEEGSRPAGRVDTRVIYDRVTGEILHIHQAVALPGIKLPDENELRASAIKLASRLTGSAADRMDVLFIREEELKSRIKYKVNVQTKCLVAEQCDPVSQPPHPGPDR
jgi:hypothetical protein